MDITAQDMAQVVESESNIELLPTTENGEPKLTERELEEFREDCNTIVVEAKAFLRVGNALRRIKAKKLYREQFKTFEICVRELFDLAARRAQQLMQASEAMDLLNSEVEKNAKNFSHFESVALPKNEGQLFALLAAPKEKRADIWLKTVESANGKPTARKIKEIIHQENVTELKGKVKNIGNDPSGKPKRGPLAADEKFDEAFRVFMAHVTDAYMDGWKTVSKRDVLAHLQSIVDYVKIH